MRAGLSGDELMKLHDARLKTVWIGATLLICTILYVIPRTSISERSC